MFYQKCPLCPASSIVNFSSREKLVQHIKIRHRNEHGKILFNCALCQNASYENYNSLKLHITRKHGGKEQLASSACTSSTSTGEAIPCSLPDDELLSVLEEAAKSYMSVDQLLQLRAASLLIQLRDTHCATQPIVNEVIVGVAKLFDTFLDILQNKFSKDPNEVLTTHEIVSCIETFRNQSLFAGVETPTELEKYIEREEGSLKPVKVTVLTKDVIKNNLVRTIDVDYGYIVPFLPSLKKILSCPEILETIENPAPVKSGVFTSPIDGYFYQNHPLVKEDPKTLGIGMYTDSVDLTDSASSKSGVHAVTFIYFVIFNIDPKLRSCRRSIFLLGVVKTSVLKKHGYGEFLKDFVAGLNQLSRREGVNFDIKGKTMNFHAIFVCCCGDNPASENLGGFKESHFAKRPCRHCLVHREDLFKSFKETDFPLRSMSSHNQQVAEVEAYFDLAPKNREGIENPSVLYGIKRKSVLMSIDGCDVTKCLPQDFMHDTIEGSLKLEICCLLEEVINSKQLSLAGINNRIQIFSKHFGVNKPSIIEMHHLENRKLRQTAAETLNLAYMLPFVLRKKTRGGVMSVCKEANLKCFMMRLQLLDYCMSEELTYDDVQKIRRLTEKHHLLFQELYNCAIPKMHYECHLNQILLYGPPRNFWCFGFEGKHAYFKRLLRIYRCFKDPARTFAQAHQQRLCGLMLLSNKGVTGPFLQSSDSLGAPMNVKLQSLLYRSGLLNFYPNISSDLMLTQYKIASYNGVKYRRNQIIMIVKSRKLPTFGEIVHMFLHSDKLMFMYKPLSTDCCDNSLNAFKVRYCVDAEFGIVAACDLPYHHQIFLIKSSSTNYVVAPQRSFAHSKL
ncbi:Krueppel-like factor 16 [Frankliniella fusca]|nr:Krueppel-like factor 16 [Frankliniella fusca]